MYSIYQDALLAPKDVAICGIEIGQLTIAQSACLWAMENPFVFSAKGSLAQFCTVLVVLQKSYPFSDIDNWVTEALALRKKLVEKPRGILKYFKKNKVYSIDDIDIEIQSLVILNIITKPILGLSLLTNQTKLQPSPGNGVLYFH